LLNEYGDEGKAQFVRKISGVFKAGLELDAIVVVVKGICWLVMHGGTPWLTRHHPVLENGALK
jgi:hypothetical protein